MLWFPRSLAVEAQSPRGTEMRKVQNTIERTPQEIREIERHKYFMSEKAGYDVGWNHAADDWEANYGEEFRRVHPQHGRGGLSMLFRRLFSA